MDVRVNGYTDEPLKATCRAARGDYYPGYVLEDPYEEVMGPVDGDTLQEKEQNLIEDLYVKGHHGPMEHSHISFVVKGASRPCMSQLRTHRHMSFDCQSQRYVDFSGPVEDVVRLPLSLRDGTSQSREKGITELSDKKREDLRERYYDQAQESINQYKELIDAGVPKEEARGILPMYTMCNFTVSGNARSWMHIFNLRRTAAAQSEVRMLCNQIAELCLDWFPTLFELYEDKGPDKPVP